ncbi:hypothetical protein SMICM304S_02600 [Streptomyces microflavus]
MFDFSNVSDIVIDNIWNEHMVCLYWGADTDNITIKNSRIRNMFADGINMTNGSTDNLVTNNEARATGDDGEILVIWRPRSRPCDPPCRPVSGRIAGRQGLRQSGHHG